MDVLSDDEKKFPKFKNFYFGPEKKCDFHYFESLSENSSSKSKIFGFKMFLILLAISMCNTGLEP